MADNLIKGPLEPIAPPSKSGGDKGPEGRTASSDALPETAFDTSFKGKDVGLVPDLSSGVKP